MATDSGDALDHMEKPVLDANKAMELAKRLYGLVGGTTTEMVSYDDKNFWLRPEAVIDNPHLDCLAPEGYTLKVTNSLDSKNRDFVEGQNLLLTFLCDNGVNCPRPVLNKLGTTFSMEQLRADGPSHAVRLLEFVPGGILGKVPWQSDFALQAGREVARINSLMDEVDIPPINSRKTEWSLWEAPAVLKCLRYVTDPSKKALVSEVLEAFLRDTEEFADYLRQDTGLIHGDFNQFNIVVQRSEADGKYTLVGVLDLGDCQTAPRLFEVALTAAYMALTSGEVEAVRDVLVGYAERRPLPAQAVKLLRVCVCARLCQSLVMGLRAHALDPSNTYVLDSQVRGWTILQALWQVPAGTFERQWLDALKLA